MAVERQRYRMLSTGFMCSLCGPIAKSHSSESGPGEPRLMRPPFGNGGVARVMPTLASPQGLAALWSLM